MTREEHIQLRGGEVLTITQHGKDRGKQVRVMVPYPNERQILVRVLIPNITFSDGKTERLISYTSVGGLEGEIPLSEQEAIQAIQEFYHEKSYGINDHEANHLKADHILCTFLKGLGYKKLVDVYERIEK